MLRLGIYWSIAIIACTLCWVQAKPLEGESSRMQENSEEKIIALQNQQADIQKTLESQLESQTNLEKDQRSLMETFKKIIPENYTEKLAKMEEQQTSLQETLNKISFDLETSTKIPVGFEERLSQMEDYQKAVGSQLETQINLAKDQKSHLEALNKSIPERLIQMEEQLTSLQKTLTLIPEDFESRLETIETNTKDILSKMEIQQVKKIMDQKTQLETLTNTVLETSKKIPVDFKERLSRMEYHQKAVGTQLETQIILAKDQKSQLEAINKYIPENFQERLMKMEEQQTSLQETLKKVPEDFKSSLETIEKYQKDILRKMEIQQVSFDTRKIKIFTNQLIAVQNQQADIQKSIKDLVERRQVETEAPKTIVIPSGFKKIGSRYFYIEEGMEKNWADAQIACREKGGYLAAIKDQEEFDALLLKLSDSNRYWLGINDINDEEVYISDASGNKAPFLKWFPGDPDNRV
nr:CD209 antigen-like [Drosophila takahashii]